jgi:hypothetical protein
MRIPDTVPQDDWDAEVVAVCLHPIEQMLKAASESARYAGSKVQSHHCSADFIAASEELARLMETNPVLRKLKRASLPPSLMGVMRE